MSGLLFILILIPKAICAIKVLGNHAALGVQTMKPITETYNYFTINVSHNGRHYFATAPRSLDSLAKAKEVFAYLQQAFPEGNGFKIDLSGHVEYSRRIEVNTNEKEA